MSDSLHLVRTGQRVEVGSCWKVGQSVLCVTDVDCPPGTVCGLTEKGKRVQVRRSQLEEEKEP